MQLLERQASGVREEDGSLQSFEAPVSPTNPVLQLNGLTVQIRHKTGVDSIIQDISFDIHPGETVALVGESGSGKSVTAGASWGYCRNPCMWRPDRFCFRAKTLCSGRPQSGENCAAVISGTYFKTIREASRPL